MMAFWNPQACRLEIGAAPVVHEAVVNRDGEGPGLKVISRVRWITGRDITGEGDPKDACAAR